MPIYTVKCKDGTDAKCTKTIDVEVSLIGLTKQQLIDIQDGCSIALTVEQVSKNNLELDDDQKKSLEESGTVGWVVHEGIRPSCDYCGSDQD